MATELEIVFGLAIDPVTGNLWDTENGDKDYDEINFVQAGSNSGWKKLMGPISQSEVTKEELVNLNGSNYSNPVFSGIHPLELQT